MQMRRCCAELDTVQEKVKIVNEEVQKKKMGCLRSDRRKWSMSSSIVSESAAIFLVMFALSGFVSVSGVEVSFEDSYSGFFVKSGHEETTDSETGTLLNRDYFIVLHPSRSTMVRVGYGPFTAKQTVPYPSSLPLVSLNQSVDLFSRWPATTDVTAYLVTKEVKREQPVLRVLFHFTQSGKDSNTPSSMQNSYQNLCVVLVAVREGRRRIAVCSPSSRDTTCLAEMIVPHSWWPPLQRAAGSKVQKNFMAVEYAVAIDVKRSECTEAHVGAGFTAQLVSTPLWNVPISPDPVRYSEVMENGSLQVLVPRSPVYAHSKIYIPVFVRKADVNSVNVFVMRARVKSGLKILEAETSMSNFWTITVDLNLKRTVATVTAFAKEDEANGGQPKFDEDFVEVFAWLLEVEDGVGRPGRLTWTVRYVREAGRSPKVSAQEDGMKMTTEVEVQKDDIQTVLLVSKTWELVNTAMLNGKQVSQPVKVFIVSQAGKVADVTLQSSCHSADESILKVSPSCTSVYLDGSEIRGSHNASVFVKYGTYSGHAHFTVWVPELPLDIHVDDSRLSQIRNWKAPKEFARKIVPRTRDDELVHHHSRGGDGSEAVLRSLRVEDQHRLLCRLRYQQTPVDVYAKFIAVDDKSSRESYLLNRKSSFRVTEIVEEYLRIADPRIATLKGRIVQGYSVGRTEIQILSPITGRVIGATELRVGKDKESITGLRVGVVTGLQLSIKANYDVTNGFVAETVITHRLTAQYQEGLLDIDVVFSDGTVTPLAHIAESDFALSVEAQERNVVALAPMASPYHPRVIALGDGNGSLYVTVEIPEGCQRHSTKPLGIASTSVIVHIKRYGDKTGLQNDDFQYERGLAKGKFAARGHDDVRGTSRVALNGLSNDAAQLDSGGSVRYGSRGPLVQARQNPVHVLEMSPLEIGMYALLGIFCLAIVLFVTSCAVYAVRFHKKQESQAGRSCRHDPVANAHDWVWLGRATLERKSVGTNHARLVSATDAAPCKAFASAASRPFEVVSVVNENASNFDQPDSRPPTPPQRKVVQIVANPIVACNPSPLRTFGGSSDDGIPPPIPPHAAPLASSRRKEQQQPLDDPPDCSENREEQARRKKMLTWTATNGLMDYEVLVEYFDNLKESNA